MEDNIPTSLVCIQFFTTEYYVTVLILFSLIDLLFSATVAVSSLLSALYLSGSDLERELAVTVYLGTCCYYLSFVSIVQHLQTTVKLYDLMLHREQLLCWISICTTIHFTPQGQYYSWQYYASTIVCTEVYTVSVYPHILQHIFQWLQLVYIHLITCPINMLLFA